MPSILLTANAQSDMTPLQRKLLRLGRAIALAGVILPMLLIGLLKFTDIEVQALQPLIGNTPWLSWLYTGFGEAGASYLLGVVELTTAALLIASPWSARAAIAGGALCAVTFITTLSILFAVPVWEEASGGFPWLNGLGAFLVKDLALLGVSLVVLADGLLRLHKPTAQP
ncbi:YkgB family protein [Pseudomonas sp. NPDC089406]|uniref:YkgB family protein n=1 Tax=Pseudomonas sp. NPDC089406 TaxID=3364463 RepID=UPI00384C6661